MSKPKVSKKKRKSKAKHNKQEIWVNSLKQKSSQPIKEKRSNREKKIIRLYLTAKISVKENLKLQKNLSKLQKKIKNQKFP